MAGGEIQPGDVYTYTCWGPDLSSFGANAWQNVSSCIADKVAGAGIGTVLRYAGSGSAAAITLRATMERAHESDLKGNLDNWFAECAGPYATAQSTLVQDSAVPRTAPPGGGAGDNQPPPPKTDALAQLAAQLRMSKDQLVWAAGGILILLLVLKK
jgi:hypothetical protein